MGGRAGGWAGERAWVSSGLGGHGPGSWDVFIRML